MNSKIKKLGRIPNQYCPLDDWINTSAVVVPEPNKPLEPSPSIIEYKLFLLQQLFKWPTLKRSLQKSYDSIDLNEDINHMLTTTDLIMETIELEKRALYLEERVPIYESLLSKIDVFCKSRRQNCTESDKRALSLLYVHTLSKINLKNKRSTDPIIDRADYFKTIEQHTTPLTESTALQIVTDYHNDIRAGLNTKIVESVDLLENGIQKEIQHVLQLLDDELKAKFKEADAVQLNSLAEAKAAVERKEFIRQNVFIRKFVDILGVFQAVLVDFGSAGLAIVNTMGDAFAENIPISNVTNSTLSLNDKAAEFIMQSDRKQLNAIERELNSVNDSLNKNTSMAELLLEEKLVKLFETVHEIKSQDPVENIHDDVASLIERFKSLANEQMTDTPDIATSVVARLRSSLNALPLIELLPDLYDKFAAENGIIDIIGLALHSNQPLLAKLHKIEKETLDDLARAHDNLKTYVNITYSRKTSAMLLQQIQKTFRSVLKRVLDSIGGGGDIKGCLVKVDVATNFIINIFGTIQHYEDQTDLFTRLTKLYSSDFNRTEKTNIRLESNLHHHIFFAEYYRAMDTLNKVMFPFLMENDTAYNLKDVGIGHATEPYKRTLNAIENIKKMNSRVDVLKSSVGSVGEIVLDFYHSFNVSIYGAYFISTQPFYTWRNYEIRDEIRQLFAGEKVYLMADVTRGSQLNAVKFNSIGIDFRMANGTSASELQDILESFHVTMTHMGNSHYRCGNRTYTINSPSREVSSRIGREYQTAVGSAGDETLSSNIALLSPYALWRFQLSGDSFDALSPFVGRVDIELHGYGQYVSQREPICETDLLI